MNNLITIEINEQMEQVTSARGLHEFLEVGTHFKDWFPRMCEYGFEEGKDFCSILSESTGGRPSTDYHMTIPMAKEISMIQRNEKGKQARQYFLKVEEAWNNPEMLMARSLQYANQKLIGQAEEIKSLENRIEKDKPMVLFAQAVSAAVDSILIRDLAKLLKKNGVPIGQNRLFDWMRGNGYIQKHQNRPTQKAVELGVLELIEGVRFDAEQQLKPTFTVKVTGKGQIYFINKFKTSEAV